jgi:hypothetical protein
MLNDEQQSDFFLFSIATFFLHPSFFILSILSILFRFCFMKKRLHSL